jgi:hypothetical protein
MYISNLKQLIIKIMNRYNRNIEKINLYFDLTNSKNKSILTKIIDIEYMPLNSKKDYLKEIENNLNDLKKEYNILKDIEVNYSLLKELYLLKQNRNILLDFFFNYYDNINLKEKIIDNLVNYELINENTIEYYSIYYV